MTFTTSIVINPASTILDDDCSSQGWCETVGGPEIGESRFHLHDGESASRTALEQFVAGKFEQVYGAAIEEFYPLLISRTDDTALSSVVGLRPGTDRPLFLEQYLDEPLDSLLVKLSGKPFVRTNLIEIGNLASTRRSGNQLMFVLLTAILERAGYEWVVFTATSQVRSLLQRLRFSPATLCKADASRLRNKRQKWGSYYAALPEVQAGELRVGMQILEGNRITARLLERNEEEIASIGSILRAIREGAAL